MRRGSLRFVFLSLLQYDGSKDNYTALGDGFLISLFLLSYKKIEIYVTRRIFYKNTVFWSEAQRFYFKLIFMLKRS